MDTVSVNQFRDNLKSFVEQVVNNHTPIKVTRRAGEAFIVVSADDWEREQETLDTYDSGARRAGAPIIPLPLTKPQNPPWQR